MRGQAWDLRTIGHAAWISPDADWQKNYFTDKVGKNIAWYRTNNLTENTMGYFLPNNNTRLDGLPYGDPAHVAVGYAPWMHAFLGYALSELCYKGYDAADVRDFALKLTVKLFTSSDAVYNRFDGSSAYIASRIYDSSMSWVTLNDLTQVHFYTFEKRTTTPTALEGVYSDGSTGVAYMALSAAVDAGIPNASQGFVFVHNQIMGTGASTVDDFQKTPTFNIVPFGAVTGLSAAPGIYAR